MDFRRTANCFAIRNGGGTGRASRPFSITPWASARRIYTTNIVESLNWSLRKISKTRGGFADEEAALKLLFLALRQAAKKWTMPDPPLPRSLEPLPEFCGRNECRPWREFAS